MNENETKQDLTQVPKEVPKEVHGLAAEELLRIPGLFVLDVRTPEEYRQGALKGATLIPVDDLSRRLGDLPPGKSTSILVYCAHGVRSLHAQEILESNGYKNVRNLRGGLAAFVHYLQEQYSS